MIEFNLLPESKLENVKARRSERTILIYSVIASIASVIILLLALSFIGLQKHALSAADKDVALYTNQIKQLPDINNILTIQNQLKTIVSLHGQSPQVTRLFTYLPQITPTQASISQLSINFDTNKMMVNGTASSLKVVNEFANTLKFTTYKIGTQNAGKTAFTSVVLSNFGRDSAGASYSFQLAYDPALFDSRQDVSLSVPQNNITTRSFIELPNSALFSTSGPTSTQGNN